MATQPSALEMNERIEERHHKIEDTVQALRQKLHVRMEFRSLAARHWKLSLSLALAGGFVAGRILRRVIF